MLTVYGLKNCDTCRKALKWLEAEGISHDFRDVRTDGLTPADIKRFAKAAGWEKLLNKASTTWRALPKNETENVGEAQAVKLMAAHPALVKRPVFEMKSGAILVGFRDDQKAILMKERRK